MRLEIKENHLWFDGIPYEASAINLIIVRPINTSFSIDWVGEGPDAERQKIDEDQMDTIIPELMAFAERNGVKIEEK